MKTIIKTIYLAVVGVSLACFTGFQAFGVTPPPDGGYPSKNTAEGQDALFHNTTGSGNTAMGCRYARQQHNRQRQTATSGRLKNER